MDNNKEYLQKFLRQLAADNKSKKTIKTYEENINKFFKEVGWEKLLTLDIETMEEYKLNMIVDKKLSKSSVNLMVNSLKSFYKFLNDKKYIKENILNDIKNIKNNVQESEFLTIDECKRFLDSVENGKGKYENRCNKVRDTLLFNLFLFSGLRLSEITNLKVSQINIDSRIIKITGKGDKPRPVPIPLKIIDLFSKYMEYRKENGLEESEFLFVSSTGKPITGSQIQKLMKKYLDLSGIIKKVSCHGLRHSFASILSSKINALELSKILGHTNVVTTMRYYHMSQDRAREIADNNPLLKRVE